MEIKLQYPYTTAAGVYLTSVRMHRPLVKDLRKARKTSSHDEGEIEISLLASLCNMIPDDFDNMDQVDYTAIQKAYIDMLEPHSKSSEKPMADDGFACPMVSDATFRD